MTGSASLPIDGTRIGRISGGCGSRAGRDCWSLRDPADATEATPTADPTEATDAADSEHGKAVAALRAKYEQYAEHRLETRPLIRVELERTVEWGELGLDTVYGG